MISLVIAILLIVPTAVLATIIAKSKRSRKSGEAEKKKTLVCTVALVVCALLLVLIPASVHTVDAGTVAVVKQLGKIQNVRTAGTYFDFWVIRTYDVYDAKVQEINIQTQAYTSDSQPMDISLTVQFQIQTDKVEEIASNYGQLQLLSSRIQNVSIERTKAILSSYKAEDLIAQRSNVSPSVEEAIREAISDKYYVTFNTAVLTDISFSDAFEAAVEAKMTAEQNKLQAEYENQKKIAAAEAELEVARARAEAKIAEAEGDAQATLAIAEAEAKALKMRAVEVARALGFAITETANADGTVIYDIDFTGKSAEEIALIQDYLKYQEYLATWDGKLPDTLVTDGNATVMITPSNNGSQSGSQTE